MAEEGEAVDAVAPVVTPAQAEQLNVDLFGHFENVFTAFLGETPERISSRGLSLVQAMRELGERMRGSTKLAAERTAAGESALQLLSAHYGASKNARLAAASGAAGMKFVLGGGSSNFGQSALAASRSMLLYCDTLLIPDPVLPWVEVSRREERFPTARILENLFQVLQLAPLARAGLGHPAIIVFPSWEKSLEQDDERTRDMQEAMIFNFFSHFLDAKLEDLSEVFAFADSHPGRLLEAVRKHRLFIAQGGTGAEDLPEAIASQRRSWKTSRSEEFYTNHLRDLPDAKVVALAIVERLGTQFHASDNAESLRASPLFSLPAQWHYFCLLQRAASDAVPELGSPLTAAGITQPSLRWLGNIPVPELVELRRHAENEKFRERIASYVATLGDVSVEEAPRVSAEVERSVMALLVEHQNEVRRITDELAQKHGATAVMSWLTFAASFATFSPYLPVFVTAPAALGLIAKYASEKVTELTKLNQHRRTLLGCLAAAARESTGD